MKQHHIQAAYLKNFEDRGLIHVYSSINYKYFKKPIKWCTAQDNFQSEDFEKSQNKLIENPGIKSLRSLLSNSNISENEYDIILRWLALHLIRNQKRKDLLFVSKEEYNKKFYEEFYKDIAYLNYYRYLDTYTCSRNKFFITSDNPILEIHPDENMFLMMPISPKKLIYFSSNGKRIVHNEISFTDFVNSMILASSYNYVFSDRKLVELNLWKDIISKWNLSPIEVGLDFIIKKI